MTINSTYFYIAIFFGFMLASALAYMLWNQRKQNKGGKKMTPLKSFPGLGASHLESPGGNASRQMQLQAYERLMLLTDRIGLPNLIQRVHQSGMTAREMQSLLTQSIRQEFEHNITQQIYVSPEAWEAVRNFKDQNLLIVNQVSSFLPAEASGNDLNRQLLDLLMQNPQTSLQNVVSEALSYEAKKLM